MTPVGQTSILAGTSPCRDNTENRRESIFDKGSMLPIFVHGFADRPGGKGKPWR